MQAWRFSPASRLHRDQRGSMSIVSVFAVLFLAMLLGMVMNAGRHVDGKLRMQNAADSAAYSGGVVLARGMNTLAFTNHLLCDVFAVDAFLREARDQNSASYSPQILAAWNNVAAAVLGLRLSQVHRPGPGHPAEDSVGAADGQQLFDLGEVGERPGAAADGRDPAGRVDSQVPAGGRGGLSRYRRVGRGRRPPAQNGTPDYRPRHDVRRALADRRPAPGRRQRGRAIRPTSARCPPSIRNWTRCPTRAITSQRPEPSARGWRTSISTSGTTRCSAASIRRRR